MMRSYKSGWRGRVVSTCLYCSEGFHAAAVTKLSVKVYV